MILYDSEFMQERLVEFLADKRKVVFNLSECAEALMLMGMLKDRYLRVERSLTVYSHIRVVESEIASLWSTHNLLSHYELYTLGIESGSLERRDNLYQLSLRRDTLKANTEKYLLEVGVKVPHIQGYIDGYLSVSDVVNYIETESWQERRRDTSDAINSRLSKRWLRVSLLMGVVSLSSGLFVLGAFPVASWLGCLVSLVFTWILWERWHYSDSSNTEAKEITTNKAKGLSRVTERSTCIYKNGSTLMGYSDGSYGVIVDDMGDNMVDDEIRYNPNDSIHLTRKS